MEIFANAKINLSLDVLGVREDGYHEVEMLMQSIGLADRITLDPIPSGIVLHTNRSYLPCDARNLAYRAAELFLKETNTQSGVKMNIIKKIPVSAGLAGGSTDAAAVLVGLNQLFRTKLSRRRLCELGGSLGSDIPFCILGGTALATGRGEQIHRLPPLPKVYLLLVKPPISISTPKIYTALDQQEITRHPDTGALIEKIKAQDISGLAQEMVNVLEPVCETFEPRISELREKLLSHGAIGARMSGSGPTVFGIFETYEQAAKAAESFRGRGDEVIVTSTRR
ncbi:MAG: 4-(cytidine 5'-diphospho)-2-C-methyl-D-erythritol kinase [Clostridia bacterium]|nr:4-(cytidine 5'-diphospho)-2-C-methyl-D-erythritol kinase [Clostridia bacterium]